MKNLTKLLMILSLMSFSVLANASSENFEKVELELTNLQAKSLFNSFPAETETIEPESFGTSIYGANHIRFSNNTICTKTVIDMEDSPEKFSCFALQRI